MKRRSDSERENNSRVGDLQAAIANKRQELDKLDRDLASIVVAGKKHSPKHRKAIEGKNRILQQLAQLEAFANLAVGTRVKHWRREEVGAIVDLRLDNGFPVVWVRWGDSTSPEQPALLEVRSEESCELSLSSPVLAASSLQPLESMDSASSNWWKTTPTLKPSLEPISPPSPSTPISAPTNPNPDSSTLSGEGFPVPTRHVQAIAPESSEGGRATVRREEILPIPSLKLDRRLQMRHALNYSTVADYRDRLEDSEPPPIEVYLIDDVPYPVNGFHRIEAATQAGRTELRAIVLEGSWEDAMLAACQANRDNGLPTTPSERRAAAMAFLLTLEELLDADDRKHLSLREIARLVGVSHTTIDNVKREIANRRAIEEKKLSCGTKVLVDGQPGVAIAVSPRQGIQVKFDVVQRNGSQFSNWVPIEQVTIADGLLSSDAVEILFDSGASDREACRSGDRSSIASELKSTAKNLGLKPSAVQVLPDIDRNEGPPDTLAPPHPSLAVALMSEDTSDIATSFIGTTDDRAIEFLSQCQNFTADLWRDIADLIPIRAIARACKSFTTDEVLAIWQEIRDRLPKSELGRIMERRWNEPLFAPTDFCFFRGTYCEIVSASKNEGTWVYKCTALPNEWQPESEFSFYPVVLGERGKE
jgi:hypothetical protein